MGRQHRSFTGMLCLATRLVAIAVSIGLVLLAPSNQVRSQQFVDRPVAFAEIVELVQKEGWLVKLGGFCMRLELPRESDICTFKQISLQETEGRGDPYGFYVPVLSSSATPEYVILVHVRPLFREFFVTSTQGVLIKVFYHSKRAGYSPMPNFEVEHEFKKDVAYWIENFARIKREVALERLKRNGNGPQ